tara:strand:+ start:28 stop:192 length:165 start_codon:yes stop_codon:yes gene_type:complete
MLLFDVLIDVIALRIQLVIATKTPPRGKVLCVDLPSGLVKIRSAGQDLTQEKTF